MRNRFPLRTLAMVLATLFVGLVCADTADACRRGRRGGCASCGATVTRTRTVTVQSAGCPSCQTPAPPPKVMPKK